MFDAFRSRPRRAILRRRIAHGDDHVERFVDELVRTFRRGVADVDARVGHGADSEWMHPACRTRPGRNGIEHVAVKSARDGFRHLASRRVARAEKQYALLHGASLSIVQSFDSRRR
jgi:hypothetical protein